MSSRVSSPYLVGRDAELAQLRTAAYRAVTGQPATVLIAGEAGIGKTRLVEAFADEARAGPGRILIGGCIQLGDDGLPFAPFIDAFRSLVQEDDHRDGIQGSERSELGRLVPDLPGASSRLAAPDEAVAQARLFEHVLGLLRRVSQDQPLTLVLEDLHWADRSTRDLARFLVRSLRHEPVLLVLTYRSDDLHRRHPLLPLLSELARLPQVETVALGRFDREETSALLAGIIDSSPDPSVVDDLFTRSDGNPFFIEELLASGGLDRQSAVPTTIREIVRVRAARLSESSQTSLRIAAVVGRRVDHDLLARLAGWSSAELIERIRPAVEERIVLAVDEADGPAYEFRHALVQEALYDDLLPAERTSLHARLATMLEARRAETSRRRRPSHAEIAHHWFRAHDMTRALAASVRAADEAADVAAYAEVSAQLERVLSLWPGVDDAGPLAGIDHADVVQRAADAAAAIGEYERAIALGRGLLAELDPDGSPDRWLEASHRLAWYQWDHGDAGGAEETITIARSVAERGSAASRMRLLTDVAQLHWSAARFVDQAAAAAEALELWSPDGDPIELARARMMLGVAQASLGDIGPGVAQLELALTALDEGPEDVRVFAVIEMAHALSIAGRYAEAVEFDGREVERLRAGGLFRRFSAYLLTDLVDALVEVGRWPEAWALLDDEEWPRDGSRASAWMFGNIAELASLQGDLVRAETAIAEARARVSPGDAALDHMWLHRAEGIVAETAGRWRVASEAFWASIARSPVPARDWPLAFWVIPLAFSTEADLAELARATRDPDGEAAALDRGRRLGAIIEQVTADAPDREIPSLRAFTALGRAEGTRLEGRSDPEAWSAAVEAFDATGQQHDAALSRYREAAARLEHGADRVRAARLLRDAHAVAGRLSARPLRERIEELATRARIDLTAEGPTSPGTSAPAPADADPYGLTAREREVLDLVAQGRTNREIGAALFITDKTASVHVTHILDKLGVSSRVEAALVAARAGLVHDR